MEYFFGVLLILIVLSVIIHKNYLVQQESFIPDPRMEILRKYFKNISAEKQIFLQNECNVKEYNRFDIEPEKEKYMKKVIYPYLRGLNNNYNFDFIINKISNITEEKDNKGNKRYIIDFFMYENNNFFVARVITDIVIFNNGSNYLNKIVLANANINHNKINTKNVYGVDTDMVIRQDNVENNNPKLDGINSSSLEYGNIDFDTQASRECRTSEVRNKWILPKGTPNVCSFPCKPESNCWDKYGVLYSCNNDPKCVGINTSATPKPFYPYYNPTTTGVPANDNKYLDLMKLTRGWVKSLWH